MYWLIFILAALCLLAALIPVLPVSHGLVRIFDFPRTQLLTLTLAVAVAMLLLLPLNATIALPGVMLLSAMVIQLIHIARFTAVWPRSVNTFRGAPSDAQIFKVLVSNVKQSNRDYDRLVREIREHDPDLALFMEVDNDWLAALKVALNQFVDSVECPLDNSYGMALFSKLEFQKKSVRFLLNERIPSFDCTVALPGGEKCRLITVHPEPPVPTDATIGRDAEISLVGLDVRDTDIPVIVTGDLNDVAWSRTTRRFLRLSGLLDPREGRGQFNSFDARWFFLRWPLDHIFHSAHFRMVRMKRLAFVGSDHFPMFFELALLRRSADLESESEDATEDDIEEAKDLIDTEKKRDRKPIGEDWEGG
ncbi:endonuclease/exonuclease/phosphatase family protein [Hoeflea sp. CAU 1731]